MCCLFKNFICCLFRNSPLKPWILPYQIIASLSRTNVTHKDLKYKHKLSKWPIYFPPFISDFGTLKFFYVHSGYELNDKVRVYLCFFQINIFYYLNFYCQFKTKYWINMPIEVLTAKYSSTQAFYKQWFKNSWLMSNLPLAETQCFSSVRKSHYCIGLLLTVSFVKNSVNKVYKFYWCGSSFLLKSRHL